jgi:hypothetical protein
MSTAILSFYQLAYAAVKTAFLLQYRRVFPLPNFQLLCAWLIFFVIIFGVSQAVVCILGCIPLEKLWKPDSHGTCINRVPFWYFNACVNLLTDLLIIGLPLPLLHTLPLKKSQKFVLMGVFTLGIL